MHRVIAAAIVAFLVSENAVNQETPEEIDGDLPKNVKEFIERSAEQRLERIEGLREKLRVVRGELRSVSRDRDLSREQRAEAREKVRDEIRATLDELKALRLNRPPFLAALRADALEVGQIGRMPSDLVGAAVKKRLGENSSATVTLHYEVLQVLGPRDGIVRIVELYDGGELGYARGESLWVRGCATEDWGKGQGVDLDDASVAFEVIGSETYKTPMGATRDVTVLQRHDVAPLLKYFPKGEEP